MTTPQFCDLVHQYMLMVVEDTKPKGGTGMGTHEQINRMLIGDIGQETQSRVDERGIRMPSWWDPRDSEGITLEQAQATALGMRRR